MWETDILVMFTIKILIHDTYSITLRLCRVYLNLTREKSNQTRAVIPLFHNMRANHPSTYFSVLLSGTETESIFSASKHVLEVRIFLVSQVLESHFVTINLIHLESGSILILACENEVESNSRDDGDTITRKLARYLRDAR